MSDFENSADLPPQAPEDAASWLRLAFVNLPAGRCRKLLAACGSPAQALAAAGRDEESLLRISGITPNVVERLQEAAARDISPALKAMETHGIRLLLEDNDDYPEALRSIPDPPPYLWLRGQLREDDIKAVAIVGTRGATEYGRGVASKLATDLARAGVVVVSGLARGVDTCAHRGAIDGGGRTFAVCGCGLDIVYPSDNRQLMLDVEQNGAALSEFAPTVHPEAWHFPARNRIISGLSQGVVVVEAGEKSGALITADFAMDQGREVFAVPGNIHRLQSRGAHGLIKQGATLVESAEDIINALNNRALPFIEVPNAAKSAPRRAEPPKVRDDLSAGENRVYLALDEEPRHVDDIASQAQMGAAEVNATLVVLELKGIARRLPGGFFCKTTS